MMWWDGHLDLAWNAVAYGRDQTQPLEALRHAERGLDDPGRETPMVSLPELRRGGVRMFHGTLFTRSRPDKTLADCLRRSDSDFPSPSIAHAAAHAQLAYYRWLERTEYLRIIDDAAALDKHIVPGAADAGKAAEPVGCVILMECADCITEIDELTDWHAAGVRAIGLTHFGQGRYAMGNSDSPQAPGLAERGADLLNAMDELGIVLDLSHLSDRSFEQALAVFKGAVMASHCNCRRLTPGDRQLSDDQIRDIVEREGVVGIAIHNGMLAPGGMPATTDRRAVSMNRVAEHIDHVCQLAGDALHVAIGSDLDGGYGVESCPHDLDTIADLSRLAPVLSQRGFGDADIARIASGNWLAFWRGAWSESKEA